MRAGSSYGARLARPRASAGRRPQGLGTRSVKNGRNAGEGARRRARRVVIRCGAGQAGQVRRVVSLLCRSTVARGASFNNPGTPFSSPLSRTQRPAAQQLANLEPWACAVRAAHSPFTALTLTPQGVVLAAGEHVASRSSGTTHGRVAAQPTGCLLSFYPSLFLSSSYLPIFLSGKLESARSQEECTTGTPGVDLSALSQGG